MKRFKTLLLAGAMLAFPNLAEARTMALLVGVADYNEESGITDLLGPRNDVTILWRALKHRGVSDADIAVLTDNLPTGPDYPAVRNLAQRAHILDELDRLAAEAQKGDTVVFYYSGHGTRQPDNPAEPEDEPETDGMDQVILPSDVGKYDPIKMTLKNAIVDDELGRKFSAIRAKGAFVWAIVDACHSGTVTRGDTVTRSVDPAALGIPDVPQTQASRGGTRKGTLKAHSTPGEGGIAGFYAVESYDQAIERPFPGYSMPMVGEEKDQRMGVFTYLMHRALTRTAAGTYRELAQEIVAELNMDHTGGKVPPPVFDGDLDQPLPGSVGDRLPGAVSGLLLDGKLTLPAGSLQGFGTGARLALYVPGAPEAPVANAEITDSTAVTSTAENIVWMKDAKPVERGSLMAVVTEPAISFRFVISPPPAADMADDALKGKIATALAESFGEGASAIGIETGEAGDPDGDVLLRVKDNRIWIVRPDRPWVTTAGAYDETPSLALDDNAEALSQELKTAIWSLARAAKLVRVASALDGAGSADDGIVIKATMARAGAANPTATCSNDNIPTAAQASPIETLLPAAAGNCDFVTIEVTNDSDQDYYIGGFYVDSLGGVAAIPNSAQRSGCLRNLPAGTGKALTFRFWIDTWDEANNRPFTTGAENFVVLAIPKEGSTPAPRLCALTQPTLAAMQQTRAVETPTARGNGSRLSTLLGAVEGSTTRAASAAPEDEGPAMRGRLFVFDVKP